MAKKIEFNAGQRAQIEQAAVQFLNMSEEDAALYVDHVEETGELSAFGAGSLLDHSHLQNADKSFINIGEDKEKKIIGIPLEEAFPGIDTKNLFKIQNADINGYENDFVCFDIHYRGTPDKPGITIGVDKKEGGVTQGALLKTDISHLDPSVAANFASYYLERFNKREFPPNMPIYKFELLETTLPDGTTEKGLVCVADQEGPLYIHNANNDFAKKDPKYAIARGAEGAAVKNEIMATAGNPINPNNGQQKGIGAVTDLDYLRNLINSHIEKDIVIPQRFIDLYMGALEHRMHMDPAARAEMEMYEHKGIKSNKLIFAETFTLAVELHNQEFTPANDDNEPALEHAEI